MKGHRLSHRGRAFTITEMLFVLMIIGVAGVVSTRLFVTSMRVIGTAPSQQAHHASIDRLSETLRRDVWSAKAIDLPDDRTIVLSEADSTTIRWRLSDANVIRTDSAGECHWAAEVLLHAEHRDNALILRSDSDRSDGGNEICFLSQSLSTQEVRQ
jgi:type II secretory pathway pseudopilin PulG